MFKRLAAQCTITSILSLSLLGGCADGKPTSLTGDTVERDEPIVINFGEPSDQNLALIGSDGKVVVGEAVETALNALPRPDGAADVERAPDTLAGDFSARGWEHDGSTVAVLAQDGLVALAMRTRVGVDAKLIAEEFSRYESAFSIEPRQIVRGPVSYWFWHDGDTRLMFVETRDESGRLILTEAIGVIAVMDELRMGPAAARSDASRANEALRNDS